MIFATIGTQAPFDRFVKMLDDIAPELGEEIVVQTIRSQYQAKNIKVIGFIQPDKFNDYFSKARLIVAHAGMGTILTALNMGKPIIIVPRIASLGEHRNDHQIATAMRMDELGAVYVAYDEKQLHDLLLRKDLKPLKHIGNIASKELITSIDKFINA
jgi:UDP-N-acetylglucosamine transferase subunit ALG13